jgi:HD-GYP domain-containing protein (c-di-GMP phosphodiesterase class II)
MKEKERLDIEQRLMIESITGLVQALEARDPYTRGHSEAVGRILSELLKINGSRQSEVERARLAGRLHDIGKIGVRDSVLLKPGKLTDAEFSQIKKHPIIGARILGAIESLSDIHDIVLYHHERFDGKGYPHGLKGLEIPLLARITAVADTFHALTSDRPYRGGMSVEKALSIINEVKGTQLCPESVRLFWRLYHDNPDVLEPDPAELQTHVLD